MRLFKNGIVALLSVAPELAVLNASQLTGQVVEPFELFGGGTVERKYGQIAVISGDSLFICIGLKGLSRRKNRRTDRAADEHIAKGLIHPLRPLGRIIRFDVHELPQRGQRLDRHIGQHDPCGFTRSGIYRAIIAGRIISPARCPCSSIGIRAYGRGLWSVGARGCIYVTLQSPRPAPVARVKGVVGGIIAVTNGIRSCDERNIIPAIGGIITISIIRTDQSVRIDRLQSLATTAHDIERGFGHATTTTHRQRWA